jgi:hypothetical protein
VAALFFAISFVMFRLKDGVVTGRSVRHTFNAKIRSLVYDSDYRDVMSWSQRAGSACRQRDARCSGARKPRSETNPDPPKPISSARDHAGEFTQVSFYFCVDVSLEPI